LVGAHAGDALGQQMALFGEMAQELREAKEAPSRASPHHSRGSNVPGLPSSQSGMVSSASGRPAVDGQLPDSRA
jgi:hypothetical protein